MYVNVVMATVILVLIVIGAIGWCAAIMEYAKRREAEEDYAKLYIQYKIYGDNPDIDTDEEMEL